MTLRDQFVIGFTKMGYRQIESRSRKYLTFRAPGGTLYFVGKSGAVRFGNNASSSLALPRQHEGGDSRQGQGMKPPKSILDKSFSYTPSSNTDIRKTIEREKDRIEQQRREEAAKKLTKIISMRRK